MQPRYDAGGHAAIRKRWWASVAVSGVIIAFNGFFFFDIARVITITTSMCWTSGLLQRRIGTTPALFPTLIGDDSSVSTGGYEHKSSCKMAARKGELFLLRYFTLARAEASRYGARTSRYALLPLNCWFLTSFTPRTALKRGICFTNHA